MSVDYFERGCHLVTGRLFIVQALQRRLTSVPSEASHRPTRLAPLDISPRPPAYPLIDQAKFSQYLLPFILDKDTLNQEQNSSTVQIVCTVPDDKQ